MLPAFAAERRPLLHSTHSVHAHSYRSISHARRALSSKPADCHFGCQSMGQTDGQTLDHYTDAALYNMQAALITTEMAVKQSCISEYINYIGRLGSRVVSVLDSGAEGPAFKSQSRCCRVTVLSKLFTPIVPLFTKQQNW